MKNKHFIITFENGKTVFSTGFNYEEAKILAQAVMIKNGMSYTIKTSQVTNNISDMADTDYIA